MKILITTDCYLPMVNGVVTSIMHLTKYLTVMGHDVKILTLSRENRSYVEENVTYLKSMDVDRIYPEARFTWPVCSEPVDRLIEWHPDIIHSQSEFSSYLIAKKIAKKLDIPIIHTYHTAYEDYTHYFSPSEKIGKLFVAKASRWLCNHLQAVIAPTEKVRKMLEGYGIGPNGNKVYVIPTGIDAAPFADHSPRAEIRAKYGVEDDTCLLFAIGRLGKEKNFEELLQYMSKIEEKNIKLMLVGDGPDHESLEKMAQELGLGDRVIFTGMVPHANVAAYYVSADLFVCASSSETQGLTYLEAEAASLPIVCRKDECLADVVRNGVNGWQYSNFDEFASYIGKLTDRDLRAEMGEAARVHMVENCSAEAFAKKVLSIYEEVVASFTLEQAN